MNRFIAWASAVAIALVIGFIGFSIGSHDIEAGLMFFFFFVVGSFFCFRFGRALLSFENGGFFLKSGSCLLFAGGFFSLLWAFHVLDERFVLYGIGSRFLAAFVLFLVFSAVGYYRARSEESEE